MSKVLDIPLLLSTLATHRPIFHSEADFQHAIAWEIQTRHPDARVRLEYRPNFIAFKMYIDVLSALPDGDLVAIELKYKTKNLSLDWENESFRLLSQSAQDLGRYDFIRDIARLESVTAAAPEIRGAALILSNDSSYWTVARDENTVDAAFRLHEGRALAGELAWGTAASAGTMKNRETPIRLAASYSTAWSRYSRLCPGTAGEFRYLLVSVVSGKAFTEPKHA